MTSTQRTLAFKTLLALVTSASAQTTNTKPPRKGPTNATTATEIRRPKLIERSA